MPLFLALLLVPLIEIALFVTVGGAIGLWPTLAIVIVTAIIGTQLIRRQGLGAFLALRSSISDLRDPTGPLFDGAMILISGALLLTPGFLTDTIGLLLLIPGLRAAIYRRIRSRVTVTSFGPGGEPAPGGPEMRGPSPRRPSARGPAPRRLDDEVIEGDFHRIDPDEPASRH